MLVLYWLHTTVLNGSISIRTRQLRALRRSIGFIGGLLSRYKVRTPFPFTQIITRTRAASSVCGLRATIGVLVDLLGSGRIDPLKLLVERLEMREGNLRS